MKKRILIPGVVALALLMALAYGMGVAASPWAQTPGLAVAMKAEASEFRVVYSITLSNSSSSAVGNIFVAGQIPAGASFVEAVAAPAGCGFKAVESGNATWLCSQVAANSSLGPISYKVSVSGKEAGPAHAWAGWKSPSEGNAMSADVGWSDVALNLPKRGCTDCHYLRDPNTGAATIAYEAKVRGGPNHPTVDYSWGVETCLGCHAPGTGEREGMGVVAPKMLRDIVHPVHMNSPSWRQDGNYKGNCFTCHNIDGQGRFTLLGVKLEKDFRGIPKTTPVQGILPSELSR